MEKDDKYWQDVRNLGVWTAQAKRLSKAFAQAMNYPSYKTHKAIQKGVQKTL